MVRKLAVQYDKMDGSGNHRIKDQKTNTTNQQQQKNTPAEQQEWLNSGDGFNLQHYFNSASKQRSHLDTVSTSVLLQQC